LSATEGYSPLPKGKQKSADPPSPTPSIHPQVTTTQELVVVVKSNEISQAASNYAVKYRCSSACVQDSKKAMIALD
jgi:hypothetical protein